MEYIKEITKLLHILLLSISIMFFSGSINITYANATNDNTDCIEIIQGTGKENNPYIIETIDQFFACLVKINQEEINYCEAYYKLATDIIINDIEVNTEKYSIIANSNNKEYFINTTNDYNYFFTDSNSTEVSITEEWNTNIYLSKFSGTIDGDGHSIKGLINFGNNDITSFIQTMTNAKLVNIKFEDTLILGAKNTISLINDMDNSTIENCSLDGLLYNGGSQSAGFASQLTNNSKILNSVNYATISCENKIGGFASVTNSGTYITNCINYGTIITKGNYTGGIVFNNNGNIINCINFGEIITTGKYPGAIISYNKNNISNCYHTAGDTVGNPVSNSGIVSSELLLDQNFYTDDTYFTSNSWDFANTWTMTSTGPELKIFIREVSTTQYTCEYYIENTDNEQFTLTQSLVYSGLNGQNVNIDIVEFAGYEFDTSNANNVLNAELNENNTIVLKAYYKLPRYTVNFVVNDFDTVTGQTTQKVKHGTSIIETPAFTRAGYTLGDWICSTNNTLTLNNITQDATFTATWSQNSYKINTSCNSGGTINVQGNAKYLDKVSLTITPNKGYYTKSVTILDEELNAITYTDSQFTMPDSSVNINVEFALIEYTINYNNSTTYQISLQSNGKTIQNGSKVTILDQIQIVVTPASGYKITSVTLSTTKATLINNIISDVNDNVQILVTTELKDATYSVKHWLEDKDQSNTTTTALRVLHNGIYYNYDRTETINTKFNTTTNATPKNFTGMSNLDFDQIYLTQDSNNIVNIYYNRNTYNINKSNCSNGTIVCPTKVKFGYTVNIQFTPNAGYELSNYTIKNTSTQANINTSFVMPASDISVSANFTPINYTITYYNVENVTNSNPTSYNIESDTIYLTDLTKPGYTFLGWATTQNGQPISNFTINNGGTGHIVLYAIWEKATFTISVQSSVGGTISVQSNAEYAEEITFVVQSNNGYSLQNITIVDDEQNIITYNNNTFTMPNSNITIIPEFNIIKYTLSFTTSDNYAIVVTKDANQITSGTQVTILDTLQVLVTPSSGYQITNITLSSTKATFVNNTITNIYDNVQILVSAELKDTTYTVKHWIEDIEQSNVNNNTNRVMYNNIYYILDKTQTINSKMNTNTNASAKTYTGMYNLDFDQIYLTEDNNAIINIYYNRNSYNITNTSCDNGTIKYSAVVKFGYPVNIQFIPNTGYELSYYVIKNITTEQIIENTTFDMPNSDIIVSTSFQVVNYTITYHNVDNVTNNNPTTYNIESDTIYLADLSKPGYTFLGWSTTQNGEPTLSAIIPTGSTGDLEYYANWQIIQYYINFESDYHSVDSIQYNILSSNIQLPTLTYTGYSFVGWFYKIVSDNQTQYYGKDNVLVSNILDNRLNITNSIQTINVNSSMLNDYNLVAKWTPNTDTNYTVMHYVEYDNGEYVLHKEESLIGTTGELICPNSLNLTGYNILPIQDTIISPTGDTILNIYYKIKTFTVKFLVETKDLISGEIIQEIKYGKSAELPTIKRIGYDFNPVGWRITSGNGNYTFVTDNLEISPTFTPNIYNIVYMDGNQTMTPDATYNIRHTFGTTTTLFTPSKTGYNFLYWTLGVDGEIITNYIDTTYYSANSTITLYAVWEIITYGITYYGNFENYNIVNTSGVVIPEAQIKDYNTSITIQNITGNIPGYNFVGWNTSSDGTGETYTPTTIYNDNNILTLYAIWELKLLTISFDVNMPNLDSIQSISKSYNQVIGELPTAPNVAGYNFLGWYMGNQLIQSNYIIDVDNDITLVARWEKLTYTISIQFMGGTNNNELSSNTYICSINDTIVVENIFKIGNRLVDIQFDNSTYRFGDGIIYCGYGDTSAIVLWESIIYYVHYDGNSEYAVGQMGSTSITYNQQITLSQNQYTRPGFIFGGWSTTPNSKSPDYNNLDNLTLHTANDITLYAIWYEILNSTSSVVDSPLINKIILSAEQGINETTRINLSNLATSEYDSLNINNINNAFVINLNNNLQEYELNNDCQLKLRLVKDQTFLYKDIYVFNGNTKQKVQYKVVEDYIIIELSQLSNGDLLIIADNVGGVVHSILWILFVVSVITGILLAIYFIKKNKLKTKTNKKELNEIRKTINVKPSGKKTK